MRSNASALDDEEDEEDEDPNKTNDTTAWGSSMTLY